MSIFKLKRLSLFFKIEDYSLSVNFKEEKIPYTNTLDNNWILVCPDDDEYMYTLEKEPLLKPIPDTKYLRWDFLFSRLCEKQLEGSLNTLYGEYEKSEERLEELKKHLYEYICNRLTEKYQEVLEEKERIISKAEALEKNLTLFKAGIQNAP